MNKGIIAFWQVTPSDLATLGSSHRDISGQALFMNTFNMDSIDSIELHNGDGTLVNHWSLLDEATGQEIFNQNGHVSLSAAAPEPPSAVLLLGVGMGVAVWYRRHPHLRRCIVAAQNGRCKV